ncbi:unnamed protein product [Cladocopium goreaui]|uniref:Exoglucanase-6A n=1 Tax=Cladocopium goreaui TaxID=2562237 RepID=A0A9P1D1J2_9DINO|nr:unnamed protein product [Cladocopium goreaui]
MQSRSQQTLGANFEVLSAGAEKALRAGCDVDLLNQGACVGDDVCVGCDLPGANAVLPQQDNRFPNNELRCEGNRTCSQNVSSATFKFASPGQVMVCIGDVTCTDVWKVSNVGAACCSSANDGDTCSNSSFNLTANDALCQNDVCCDGTRVCTNSTMDDVESLLCRGLLACSDSQVILEQDLYCNATSESNPSSSGSTCTNSSFTFVANDTHVVDCLGDFVCEDSTFSFNENSAISFECDSEAAGTGGGQGACNEATINLAPGTQLEHHYHGYDEDQDDLPRNRRNRRNRLLGGDWTHLFPSPKSGDPFAVFKTFQEELSKMADACDAYNDASANRPFPECFPMYVNNPRLLELSVSL